LIELKVNDWLLYLISGLVWGLWHLPYYLVFVDAGIFEVLSVSRMGFALIAAIIMLCWNVVYVELFRLTRSLFPDIIMHAAEDGVVMFLFAGGYYVFANNLSAWIFDPHIGVIATVFILGAGLRLRTIRIKTTP
jgi:membrane protease YdiL (CAAX protease family)